MNQNILSELAERIRAGLAEGFDGPEVVLELAIESVSTDDDDPGIRDAARSVLAQVMEERQREQQDWPAITDCDRLDAAFEELNATGIAARHHWTCCGTCGVGQMQDELERLSESSEGPLVRGYAFYDQQGTEFAASDGLLYLNFGSAGEFASDAEYEARSVEIAIEVRDVLESHGLAVTWDGTYGQRPAVTMVWQRRQRPPRFCEE